jgi:hypothetical protein
VGRLENRLRRLEETVERGGFAAALSMASDADIFTLADYNQRAHAAEEAGEPLPMPTPEEVEAAQRFKALRVDAMRRGWGESSYRSY